MWLRRRRFRPVPIPRGLTERQLLDVLSRTLFIDALDLVLILGDAHLEGTRGAGPSRDRGLLRARMGAAPLATSEWIDCALVVVLNFLGEGVGHPGGPPSR